MIKWAEKIQCSILCVKFCFNDHCDVMILNLWLFLDSSAIKHLFWFRFSIEIPPDHCVLWFLLRLLFRLFTSVNDVAVRCFQISGEFFSFICPAGGVLLLAIIILLYITQGPRIIKVFHTQKFLICAKKESSWLLENATFCGSLAKWLTAGNDRLNLWRGTT